MLFWCFFAFLPFSVRPIVYTTIFFSWWCLCVWLHAIREGENEKLKVKQIRHACMQHCVHGRKIALGPRNEFSSNPRFLLFVIFYIFVEVVHQRALFLLSKAYNLFYFFIENLVIHETIAGQKQEQFYYVVKLHMDAFKWLVSIAHNAHFMQYTERKKIKFYCSLFCNDFMEQKKVD